MSNLTIGTISGKPVNNNVVAMTAGHTLYSPGSVVQMVDYKYPSTSDTYTTIADGTSYQTPISVTITPKFSTSKLVIHSEAQCRFVAAYGIIGQLKRDGSYIGGSINNNSLFFMYKGDAVNHHIQVHCNTSVTAGSVAPTTFTMFVQPYAGTGEFNSGWGNNYIQVWEIAQ